MNSGTLFDATHPMMDARRKTFSAPELQMPNDNAKTNNNIFLISVFIYIH